MNKMLCGAFVCVQFMFSSVVFGQEPILALNDAVNGAGGNSEKSVVAEAKVELPDSVLSKLVKPNPKAPITLKSFVVPAGLIAAGTTVLISENTVGKVNTFVKETIYKPGCENKLKIDNYTMFVPGLAVFGLNAMGIKGKHKAGEAFLLYFVSSAVCNGVVFATKDITKIQRPNEDNYLSFPSGHTAQAFVSAEFLRQEYKEVSPWYGTAGYVLAIGTGVLRMYHDKHWLSDVVAGAGVGIASTRLTYWLYPKVKKAVFPKSKSNAMVSPTYSNGALGFAFACTL